MGTTLSKSKHKFGKYQIVDIVKRYKPGDLGKPGRVLRRSKKVMRYLNNITIDDFLISVLEKMDACYSLNDVSLLMDDRKSLSNRMRRAKKYPHLYKELEKTKKRMGKDHTVLHTTILPNDPCMFYLTDHNMRKIENVPREIRKILRNCKKRWIYMNVGIYYCHMEGAHANQVIIDLKKNTLYYFEPFISFKSSEVFDHVIKSYFSMFGKFKFVHSNDILAADYPAALQALLPEDINCISWSTYYGLLRILNPDIPDRVLIDYMGGSDPKKAYYMINNFVYNIYVNYRHAINRLYYDVFRQSRKD